MNDTLDPSSMSEPNSNENKVNYLLNITVFLLSVICITGVIGNGLVIYVTGFRMKKTVNTVWFLNLALADFLFTFFLIFGIVNTSRNFNWPFGDFMCKLYNLVIVINMFASIFLLTAISLDRCLSTWIVVWVQNKRTLLKARVSCFFIWLASISCGLPYGIYRKTQFDEDTQETSCHQDFTLAMYKSLVHFRFVVGFLIPFIIITCSYVAIGIRVRRLQQRAIKPFKTILTVILAFFFCWLPFHIYMFIDVWAHETWRNDQNVDLDNFRQVLNIVGALLTILAFLNSCLNPFLYVFMCEEFKTKLKQSLEAVFESAFAEEHLALLVSQHSFRHRKSHSQSIPGVEDTQSSAVNQ